MSITFGKTVCILLNIHRRVRLSHIFPSYINFSSGHYSINSSNAVFATILNAPLPIRSYNDSKYVLTNRSRKKKMYAFICMKSMLPLRTRHPVAICWFSGIYLGSSQTRRSYFSLIPSCPNWCKYRLPLSHSIFNQPTKRNTIKINNFSTKLLWTTISLMNNNAIFFFYDEFLSRQNYVI